MTRIASSSIGVLSTIALIASSSPVHAVLMGTMTSFPTSVSCSLSTPHIDNLVGPDGCNAVFGNSALVDCASGTLIQYSSKDCSGAPLSTIDACTSSGATSGVSFTCSEVEPSDYIQIISMNGTCEIPGTGILSEAYYSVGCTDFIDSSASVSIVGGGINATMRYHASNGSCLGEVAAIEEFVLNSCDNTVDGHISYLYDGSAPVPVPSADESLLGVMTSYPTSDDCDVATPHLNSILGGDGCRATNYGSAFINCTGGYFTQFTSKDCSGSQLSTIDSCTSSGLTSTISFKCEIFRKNEYIKILETNGTCENKGNTRIAESYFPLGCTDYIDSSFKISIVENSSAVYFQAFDAEECQGSVTAQGVYPLNSCANSTLGHISYIYDAGSKPAGNSTATPAPSAAVLSFAPSVLATVVCAFLAAILVA